jgi:hypothetical protein
LSRVAQQVQNREQFVAVKKRVEGSIWEMKEASSLVIVALVNLRLATKALDADEVSGKLFAARKRGREKSKREFQFTVDIFRSHTSTKQKQSRVFVSIFALLKINS